MLEKAAAVAALVTLLAIVAFASLAISTAAAGLNINAGHLAAAAAATGLLGLLYGSIALAIGAASGRRGLALAVAGAAAGAAYIANALGSLVSALKPLRDASPFYQYGTVDPLRHGLTFAHATPLAVGTIVFIAAAVTAFTRRDLT